MFLQNLFFRHAMGQPAEDVIHRDPHPTNARFAVALISLKSDTRVYGGHVSIIAQAGVIRADSRSGRIVATRRKAPHGGLEHQLL